MASSSSSIYTFSPYFRPGLHNSKIQKHSMHNTTLKPPPPSSINSTYHIHNSHSLSSQFHILHKPPLSNLSPINCSHSLVNNFSKFCTQKFVVLLVGSILLMGCLSTRPVVALPTQKSSGYSERMEEKKKTQNGNCDDDEEEEKHVKLLEENPRNVEALKVVFHGKMRKGKTKEAVEYVEKLIDIEPGEVGWRLLQALCYEMIGELSKAKRLFKEILAERPLLLRALHGLAMVMHKNHEGPAVFEMLNKALEVALHEKRVTEERNIKILIAQMHVVKGELEQGLKKFQNLVDENPRDFRPYLCQGIIYSLLDKKKEAEEQFLTYQSLVPEEFPQRGFLDDVVLAAKRETKGAA